MMTGSCSGLSKDRRMGVGSVSVGAPRIFADTGPGSPRGRGGSIVGEEGVDTDKSRVRRLSSGDRRSEDAE